MYLCCNVGQEHKHYVALVGQLTHHNVFTFWGKCMQFWTIIRIQYTNNANNSIIRRHLHSIDNNHNQVSKRSSQLKNRSQYNTSMMPYIIMAYIGKKTKIALQHVDIWTKTDDNEACNFKTSWGRSEWKTKYKYECINCTKLYGYLCNLA